MSASELLKKYIWLFETINNNAPISLKDLIKRFKAHFNGSEELSRETFFRHKRAIEELFGIEIEYIRSKGGYVIANKDDLNEKSMQQWILQTFSVSTMLSENQDLKKRILLEHIPSGQQHLQPIMKAMRGNKVLKVRYNSFRRGSAIEMNIEPWCIKYFEQRWYLFGKEYGKPMPKDSKENLYFLALDRVKDLGETDLKFSMPKKFDAEEFLKDYYGVMLEDENFDVQPIAILVDAAQCPYLRTVPLHHSQYEAYKNEHYSIFEYKLCPTFDFRQKLFSLSDSIEVLAPKKLADMMRKDAEEMVRAYKYTEEQGSEYKFKEEQK